MLHAETSHIRQLDTIWLRTSDFSAQDLYRLKDSDIVDAGDCPRGKPQYDNYTINQYSFSNLFCKMIEENL